MNTQITNQNSNNHIESELITNDDSLILSSPEDLVKLLTAKRQMLLLYSVKNDMSFKEFTNGKMKIALSEKSDKNLLTNLRNFLKSETGLQWTIDVDYEPLGETLAFKESKDLEKDKKNISEYPLVKAILSEFSGAKIETIIRKALEDSELDDSSDFIAQEFNNENYEDEEN